VFSVTNVGALALVMLASVGRLPFGATADGLPVELFTLTNAAGIEVRVASYGATLVSIRTPDRTGRPADITLGFDSLEPYLTRSRFFGALVGRYANRIAGGRFAIDGQTIQLPVNSGTNHIHGGVKGFDKVLWKSEPFERDGSTGVRFTYTSRDGEENYPGTLTTTVTYTLTPASALVLDYTAKTDKPTIVNLTQHSYFNLAGEGHGNVLGHEVMLNADRFTPVDSALIPTGELAAVAGTPFDFRTPTAIGARIDADHPQLALAGGYDHNFVLNSPFDSAQGRPFDVAPGRRPSLHLAARVVERSSGRTLQVDTTEPGVQFYTGNKLTGATGKAGHVYGPRSGVCLETQHFPDSPNQPQFPSTVLRPGETYHSTTVFTFGVMR
jgi:aldose 1-epimerase